VTPRHEPILLLLLATALGCTAPGPPPSGDDDDSSGAAEALALVVTSDYVDSILATVDLDEDRVTDSVAAFSSGDVIPWALDGEPWLAFRGEGALQRYDAAALGSGPLLEFSVGSDSNPVALASCGGKLFVSLYDSGRLAAYDPETGAPLGSLDLSPWAEDGGDGRSEPGTLVVDGSSLIVALERYSFLDFAPDPIARGLRIDCASLEVLEEFELPSNARIQADPSDGADLLVHSGAYFSIDGGLHRFDLESGGLSSTLVEEAELGADITAAAALPGHVVLSTWDFEADRFGLHCIDLQDGSLATAEDDLQASVWTLAPAPGGEVWALLGPPLGEVEPAGIGTIDPTSCTLSPEASWHRFGLPPTAVAFP